MKINLTNEEIKILKTLAKKINVSPSQEPQLFCKEIKSLLREIPEPIYNTFIHFKKYGSKTGCLLLHITSEDDMIYPPTPDSNQYKLGETTELSKIQAICMSIMGEMVSYEAEGYGNLFQDVVPVKSMLNQQASTGSNFELEIHTEQAFSQLRPDILSLSCLRGDPNALTYILHLESILSNMSEHEIELLKQPLWKIGVDLSFKMNENEFVEGNVRGPFPIIQGTDDNPVFVFDQDLMFGITEESDSLIDKIVNLYYIHRNSYNLTSGDIIFIDNNRAVHGRSSFFPKFDGLDRFLIRSFLVFDYERVKYACIKRENMISAIFS
jgi:L-asparagine oxygenase